ncbi:MAG TPA: DsbE family thiol:disulfide interchange protein [Porticoccaceae bacterium]|nr:DsbE family thiol:disulfide interchange protein [Porticoccaceae bacterium]HCO60736.1 DsbE family thiol:disulfide interchange protein [Porticoccaceae bacterium]
MARIKLFIPLFIFLVLAVLLYWGLGRDPSAMPSALVGKSVPAFKLPALADETSMLDASLFQGQVSLLNVWATWCPSCRVEHPFLMELAKQGVPIIGLDYKDERDKALAWLADYGDPYKQVIFDPQGTLGLDLGVFGAPETYLVDAEGRIHFKRVGVVDARVWEQDFAPRYQALLDGETPVADPNDR